MDSKSWRWMTVLGVCLALGTGWQTAQGATFGQVVAIGGHASDLALDETRGVLYIANFTANRVEVMSLANGAIQTSINVSAQPASLAISPDGKYLVVAHYGNFQAPNSPANGLTVIDLATRAKQTFVLGFPPLGVAFGIDNRALVVTTTDFLLFDPVSGVTTVLDTVQGVAARSLPVPAATFPPNIVAASLNVSGDGLKIYGLTDTIEISYDVNTRRLSSINYTSAPPQGPRVVSVSRDGSYYLSGWALMNPQGVLLAQFPNPRGDLNIGSHAIDSARGVVYAQIPAGSTTTGGTTPPGGGTTTPATPGAQPPVLQVLDADNLRVRERLSLAENLAGKSLLSADGGVMYSISDSGVTILQVGTLNRSARVVASTQDIVFRGNFCDRRVATQEIVIQNPGGGNTDFTLTSTLAGVTVTPTSGVTPAVVRVTVDPNAFQNVKGTVTGAIQISSRGAVNLPPSVRVLVNNREPEQRGTFVNVPGKLVDLLADPVRDRFFLLRQDTNEVLVFDGANYTQIGSLRTGNTPTQLAISFDRRWLLVGNDNSQIANVFDLETLEPSTPIRMPFGHYPRSIASSGRAMLAATRVAGAVHKIDRIDMITRTATELPTLGVYENTIDINTVLAPSPSGSAILVAQAGGGVLLYNANVDSFTVSRKDTQSLKGAVAASSFDQFVVGNLLLNASLVVTRQFETGTGDSSGFAFLDQFGFRTTSPVSGGTPGVIQRVDLQTGQGIRPTRMAEGALLGETGAVFTRALAPLYSRNVIVNLTTSGFTVLSFNYDAAVAAPQLDRVANAAESSAPLSPGGLISIYGRDLSPVNLATRELPLPTALGESCLTVNGVPVPILFVSPSQVNAQMPFNVEGNVTMILRTPGGTSDNFNLLVRPTGPGVFRTVLGPLADIATVVRASNGQLVTLSNPVHRGDTLTIYLTGLGRTFPAIDAGVPAPADPLPSALIEPEVRLAGVSLPIAYAGLTPGQVGLYQINVLVPHWVNAGRDQPLLITQGGSSTALEVRVVE